MKKSILLVVFIASAMGVSAQSNKVQSAYSDMKNERLAYAKKNIDDACKNEKTINDAKTWNYAGLIYAQIVDASNNNPKLFKKQKIDTPVEELCEYGLECLKKSLELEKKEGTHEYTSSSIEAMKVLCGYEYMFSSKIYNAGQYDKAVSEFDKVINNAQICGYNQLMLDAMYYKADCYRMLKQTDKELDLYRQLAKLNTDKADVYLKIYAANKNANDTTKAINALKKGVKMTAKDTTSNVLMKSTLASAYLWSGNRVEADKILSELLEKGPNDTKVLNSVANIYVDQGQAEKAIELFNKSLSINNNQIEAYRGMGLVYYNKAVDEKDAADKLPPDPQYDDEYNQHKLASFNAFASAEPYFTKALTLNDKDFQSLKALTTIYSQLSSRSDATAEKKAEYKKLYQEVSAKLNTLVQ